MPNTNPKTGLPFGVIAGQNLDPELLDALYVAASAQVYDRMFDERRTELRRDLYDLLPDAVQFGWVVDQLSEVIDVQLEEEAESGAFGRDEPSAEIVYEGVTVIYSYLGGAPIVFSYDGPVAHVRSMCSPCVPGAASLDSGEGDIACHGLPEDWLSKEY